MNKVSRFTLNAKKALLTVTFERSKQKPTVMSYEFVRVFSPQNDSGEKPVAHKKQVRLLAIESVAKYGYRLIFNDQHQAIYTDEDFSVLCAQHDTLWQEYLAIMKGKGLSREALINITQL